MKATLISLLSIALSIGYLSPAQADEASPTIKVSNVSISAVGVDTQELMVSWVNPSSFSEGHQGFEVILKNSAGATVDTMTLESLTATRALFRSLVNDTAYSAEVATLYESTSLLEVGTQSAKPYGIPAAPSKPTVSRTASGEIYVDWDAPANNGNAISSYTVACTPVCSESAITTSNTHQTIRNLVTSNLDTVTVVATNARGNSPASVASDALAPHADATAPADLVVTAGDGQVVASWSAASISGATVSSYTVQLFSESAPTTVIETKSVTTPSATFTGLTNGLRYFFKVSTLVGSLTSAPATSLYGLTAAAVVVTPPAPNPPAPNPPAPNPPAPTPPSQVNSPSSSADSGTPSTPAAAPAPAAPAPAQPTSKVKQRTPGASLARQIGMTVPPKAKIKLKVAKASKKICRVSGSRLVALKRGSCSVTVTVTPKKTKKIKKPKAIKRSTVVAIS